MRERIAVVELKVVVGVAAETETEGRGGEAGGREGTADVEGGVEGGGAGQAGGVGRIETVLV